MQTITQMFRYHDLLNNKMNLRLSHPVDGDIHLIVGNKSVTIPEVGVLDKENGVVYLPFVMDKFDLIRYDYFYTEYETMGGV